MAAWRVHAAAGGAVRVIVCMLCTAVLALTCAYAPCGLAMFLGHEHQPLPARPERALSRLRCNDACSAVQVRHFGRALPLTRLQHLPLRVFQQL